MFYLVLTKKRKKSILFSINEEGKEEECLSSRDDSSNDSLSVSKDSDDNPPFKPSGYLKRITQGKRMIFDDSNDSEGSTESEEKRE